MLHQKRLLLLGLILSSLGVLSCVFSDSGDSSSWFKANGVPSTTRVVALSLDSVAPVSARTGLDSLPYQAQTTGSLGQTNGTRQELFLTMMVTDTVAHKWLDSVSGSWSALQLALDSGFYAAGYTGHALPLTDEVVARFSWKIMSDMTITQKDSVLNTLDSNWWKVLREQVRGNVQWDTASASYSLNLTTVKAPIRLRFPEALQTALQGASGMFHLQLRVTLQSASRVYRVNGPNSHLDVTPQLLFVRPIVDTTGANPDSTKTYVALADSTLSKVRMAQVGFITETCSDCLVLHGGMRESLLVEIPGPLVWEALKQKLGDSLLQHPGQTDSLYLDQFVLMASIDIPSDTGSTGSEMGYPVPVLAYSPLAAQPQSGTLAAVVTETRIIDTAEVLATGHSNLLYYPAHDTLQIQVTQGFRHWLEAARMGTPLRTSLRLGRPMVSPKEYHSTDYTTINGTDTTNVQIYSKYPSHSRWNLGSPESLRFRVRLWLTERS